MPRRIVLDAGPLGMIAHPKMNADVVAWLKTIIRSQSEIIIPEIADYEVRREMLRAGMAKSIERLDALKASFRYLPITTQAMLTAAEFWAKARQMGRPSGDSRSLDGDVILAAQTKLLEKENDETFIATDNVGHLNHFVKAVKWSDIR